MITAIEFGEKHGSCSEAMTWRRSLPTGTTQADAWLACERGEWLFWQLSHGLSAEEYEALRPAIKRASAKIAQRAVLRAHLACVDAGIEIPEWEVWAFEYVTGVASAAWSAARSASASAARSARSATLPRLAFRCLVMASMRVLLVRKGSFSFGVISRRSTMVSFSSRTSNQPRVNFSRLSTSLK